jgi:hypothetical protein
LTFYLNFNIVNKIVNQKGDSMDNLQIVLNHIESGKGIADVSELTLSEKDKIFLHGKARDYRAEAEYFETYEHNEVKAAELYKKAQLCFEVTA